MRKNLFKKLASEAEFFIKKKTMCPELAEPDLAVQLLKKLIHRTQNELAYIRLLFS
jgi:hypothetical protein